MINIDAYNILGLEEDNIYILEYNDIEELDFSCLSDAIEYINKNNEKLESFTLFSMVALDNEEDADGEDDISMLVIMEYEKEGR